MAFTFKHYGTFTGPNSFDGDYDYDALSREGFWWNDLPIDNTFKIRDLGVLFFNNPSDYLGFYLNGVSTSLVTMTRNTSNIPTFIAQIDDTIFNGNIFANGEVVVNGSVWANEVVFLNGVGDVASAINNKLDKQNKGFDIPHPNKKGHRLRHICVEGPENGPIYIRGKLDKGNVIELPDYWDGLVDKETITAHLTPIGVYQELFVDSIEWGKKVIIKNNSGSSINCYYQIWAERKFDEKLHVEYEGESPADYPGNPDLYSIAGYDYDRR